MKICVLTTLKTIDEKGRLPLCYTVVVAEKFQKLGLIATGPEIQLTEKGKEFLKELEDFNV